MKKKSIIIIFAVISIAGLGFWYLKRSTNSEQVSYKTLTVSQQDIQNLVRATGTVYPRNRLEIRPPIAGRIDTVLINEGDYVKKSTLLAWMSSTERAALLDAARARSAKELKEWQEFYKPTPVFAPLRGRVIANNVRPGQTVTAQDVLFVLSDDLIVKAQVDETDLARIRNGQKANIVIDSYSETDIPSKVTHIAFEATTVNNVTIYEVELSPDKTPTFMRSGMTATVDFVIAQGTNLPALPQEAVSYDDNGQSYVLRPSSDKKKPEQVSVVTGMANDRYIEIKEGLSVGDQVLVKISPEKTKTSSESNPFSPSRKPKSK